MPFQHDTSMNRDDVMVDDTEILHDGFFRMEHFLFRHRLYEGGWSTQLSREILVRSPVTAVIPYDPVRDEIVLIKQFCGGIYASGDKNPWSVEIVAGSSNRARPLLKWPFAKLKRNPVAS